MQEGSFGAGVGEWVGRQSQGEIAGMSMISLHANGEWETQLNRFSGCTSLQLQCSTALATIQSFSRECAANGLGLMPFVLLPTGIMHMNALLMQRGLSAVHSFSRPCITSCQELSSVDESKVELVACSLICRGRYTPVVILWKVLLARIIIFKVVNQIGLGAANSRAKFLRGKERKGPTCACHTHRGRFR
jgi:hypothetical protein